MVKNISLALAAALMAAALSPAAHAGEPSRQAQAARAGIERTTGTVLRERGRDMTVTSRHRDNSPAHARGAIDIRSRDQTSADRHADARAISARLGRGHTVVVEEVHRTNYGPSAQRDTAYRGGVRGNTRWGPVRGSATHTHIQPDRSARGRAQAVR